MNLIDVIIVSIVIAVVVAGFAAFTGHQDQPGEAQEATIHATLNLGELPDYIASKIEVGDTYTPSQASKITITDVYVTQRNGSNLGLVRVAMVGEKAGDTIKYNGSPPRLGRVLKLKTDLYEIEGRVIELAGSPKLPKQTTNILVTAHVPSTIADQIRKGDTYRVGGRVVGEVRSVTKYTTEKTGSKRLFIGLSLRTINDRGETRFGTTPIRVGGKIQFVTAEYKFAGRIRNVGTTELSGESTSRSVTVRLDGVDPNVARNLEVGMVDQNNGQTVGRVTAVNITAASVILTSQDGEIYRRSHPYKKDVTLEVALTLRETKRGLMFKGKVVEIGSTIVLDFGDLTVKATIVSL